MGARLTYSLSGPVPIATSALPLFTPRSEREITFEFGAPASFVDGSGATSDRVPLVMHGSHETKVATLWLQPGTLELTGLDLETDQRGSWLTRFFWTAPSPWCFFGSVLSRASAERVVVDTAFPGERAASTHVTFGLASTSPDGVRHWIEITDEEPHEVWTSEGLPCPTRALIRTTPGRVNVELVDVAPGTADLPSRGDPPTSIHPGAGPKRMQERGLPADAPTTPFPFIEAFRAAQKDASFMDYLRRQPDALTSKATRQPIEFGGRSGHLISLDFADPAGGGYEISVTRLAPLGVEMLATDGVPSGGSRAPDPPEGWSAERLLESITVDDAEGAARALTAADVFSTGMTFFTDGSAIWDVRFTASSGSSCSGLSCNGNVELGTIQVAPTTGAVMSYQGPPAMLGR